MYIGRGINYPIALEGALKLKEISYLHAEGYAAGELKHGPIALLDKNFPVLAIVTQSATAEKVASNVQEVLARDAPVLALVSEGDHTLDDIVTDLVEVPAVSEFLSPVCQRGGDAALCLLRRHRARLQRRPAEEPGEERHRRVAQ